MYKSRGSPSFDQLRALTKNDFRSNLFLDIFEALYFEYERALNTTKSIDYADMINQATEAIKDQILLSIRGTISLLMNSKIPPGISIS